MRCRFDPCCPPRERDVRREERDVRSEATKNKKIKQTMRFIILSSLLVALLAGCEPAKDKKGKVLDTPTTGTLRLMIDEGYRPILETSMDVFDSIYSLAHFEPTYTSEGEAVAALLRDSVQVVVITRKLNEAELQQHQSRLAAIEKASGNNESNNARLPISFVREGLKIGAELFSNLTGE